MRSILGIILIILFSHSACDTRDQCVTPISEDEDYVTKFNADGMAKKHLADFNLVRKRVMWNQGRRLVYENKNTQVDISFQVGLHPSAKDAEEIALDHLKYISIAMTTGQMNEESIGDKFWWWSPNSDPAYITAIVFIRKNALIMISSHDYKEITELAKAIDDDIIHGESYLSVEKSVSSPIIHSIIATKTELKEGETCKIAVNACDPHNEPLEYDHGGGGSSHAPGEPDNIFVFRASRANVPEPFVGTHILKFVVINESNAVSETAEVQITITQ